MYERTDMEGVQMDDRDVCVSVFKNAKPCRTEYTAIWVTLVNRWLKDPRALASAEERT